MCVFLVLGKFDEVKSIDDRDEWSTLEAQAAFLGPNLWDNDGTRPEIQLGDQVCTYYFEIIIIRVL
jgi:hypothetical protein